MGLVPPRIVPPRHTPTREELDEIIPLDERLIYYPYARPHEPSWLATFWQNFKRGLYWLCAPETMRRIQVIEGMGRKLEADTFNREPPQSIIATIPYQSYTAMQGRRTLALMQEIEREIEARNSQDAQLTYATQDGMVIGYPDVLVDAVGKMHQI